LILNYCIKVILYLEPFETANDIFDPLNIRIFIRYTSRFDTKCTFCSQIILMIRVFLTNISNYFCELHKLIDHATASTSVLRQMENESLYRV